MIWKNMINKRGWTFCQAELSESVESLENPARGWYGIYTFPVQEKIDSEELRWSLRRGETLAMVLLDIYKYRSKPLEEAALKNIRDILSFFLEYKMDVILRPVYDREGKGQVHEPDSFSMVLEHMTQIGKILKDMKHSVCIFQGMLAGSWGEMHDSQYLSPEHMKQMWKCMRQYLGDRIYLAVRTPAQWRILTDKRDFEEGKYAGLTLFDDGILGSLTHLGTFGTMTKEAAGWTGTWMRKEELEFISTITEEMPCGGEVTAGAEEYDADFVINELTMMHLTYLDSTYDRTVLDHWKEIQWKDNGIWQGKSLYEYIGNHLGYRLIVTRVEMNVLWRGNVEFLIEIENVGFGRLFQETELFLIIKNRNSEKRIVLPMDITKLYAGTTRQVRVVAEPVEGEVFLKLCRKNDGRNIRFANRNSADHLLLGYLRCGDSSYQTGKEDY